MPLPKDRQMEEKYYFLKILQQHPLCWDRRTPEYKSEEWRRPQEWQEVAEKMRTKFGVSYKPSDVSTMFKTMYDSLRRERRKVAEAKEDGKIIVSKWAYTPMMSYINDVLDELEGPVGIMPKERVPLAVHMDLTYGEQVDRELVKEDIKEEISEETMCASDEPTTTALFSNNQYFDVKDEIVNDEEKMDAYLLMNDPSMTAEQRAARMAFNQQKYRKDRLREEKKILCELVHPYPAIWDRRRKDFKRGKNGDDEWNEIAEHLNRRMECAYQGHDVRVMFKSLLDSLRRERLRILSLPPNTTAKSKWEYVDHLGYLIDMLNDQDKMTVDFSKYDDFEDLKTGQGPNVEIPVTSTSQLLESVQLLPKETDVNEDNEEVISVNLSFHTIQTSKDVHRGWLADLKSGQEYSHSPFVDFQDLSRIVGVDLATVREKRLTLKEQKKNLLKMVERRPTMWDRRRNDFKESYRRNCHEISLELLQISGIRFTANEVATLWKALYDSLRRERKREQDALREGRTGKAVSKWEFMPYMKFVYEMLEEVEGSPDYVCNFPTTKAIRAAAAPKGSPEDLEQEIGNLLDSNRSATVTVNEKTQLTLDDLKYSEDFSQSRSSPVVDDDDLQLGAEANNMEKMKYAVVCLPESKVVEFFKLIADNGFTDVSFVDNLSKLATTCGLQEPSPHTQDIASSNGLVPPKSYDQDTKSSSSSVNATPNTRRSAVHPIDQLSPSATPPHSDGGPLATLLDIIGNGNQNAYSTPASTSGMSGGHDDGSSYDMDRSEGDGNGERFAPYHQRMKGWQRTYLTEMCNNGYPTERQFQEAMDKCGLSRRQVVRYVAKRVSNPHRAPRADWRFAKAADQASTSPVLPPSPLLGGTIKCEDMLKDD